MTGAEVLVALLVYAGKNFPEVVEALKDVIEGFKAEHPAIGDAPPADEEKRIDAEFDAEIAKLEKP